MNLGELIGEYRILAQDTANPYFCGDQELTKWFNDAETEAATRARLIRDIEELPVLAGESAVDLPAEWFAIQYAELRAVSGEVYPIVASSRDKLNELKPGWRQTTERPEYFVHDDKSLLLGAIPDADYTLYVEVFRAPRAKMKQDTDTPEIHAAHHEGLIQWVLHKAYAKPDGDLFDPGKSASAEVEFTRQFGKRPTADLRRRQNANRPHRNRVHL